MKILFLIDPADLWLDMLVNRFDVFSKMVSSLGNLADISLALPQKLSSFDNFSANLPCKYFLLPDIKIEEQTYGDYHLSAINGTLSRTDLNAFRSLHVLFEQLAVYRYDIVITNSPLFELRGIFKNSIVFNYELGIFNRSPFPKYHQLDPIGFYKRGLIYNAPFLYCLPHSDHNVQHLQSEILKKNLTAQNKIQGIFYPIQSENNWPIRQEGLKFSISDYVKLISYKFSATKVYYLQKSGYPINEATKTNLSGYANVEEIDFKIDAAALVPCFDSIFSINSSLGFQAVFWDKQLIAPRFSSLYPWSHVHNHKNLPGLIGGLLETFWIRDEIIQDGELFKSRLNSIWKLSNHILNEI